MYLSPEDSLFLFELCCNEGSMKIEPFFVWFNLLKANFGE